MPDSFFGSDSDLDDLETPPGRVNGGSGGAVALHPSSSVVPVVPGFHLFHKALPRDLHDQLAEDLSRNVWSGGTDQVMLFERTGRSSFPAFLQPLLDFLPSITSTLPAHVQELLDASAKPRQAILNLYHPGQGITPHVDLPSRYADGILGVSLLSSTVMDFRPVSPASSDVVRSVRLSPGDIYVLSGEARWNWTHGIAYRDEDVVADENGEPMLLRRGVRMSITLRRMKDGAEVIGSDEARVAELEAELDRAHASAADEDAEIRRLRDRVVDGTGAATAGGDDTEQSTLGEIAGAGEPSAEDFAALQELPGALLVELEEKDVEPDGAQRQTEEQEVEFAAQMAELERELCQIMEEQEAMIQRAGGVGRPPPRGRRAAPARARQA